MTKTSTVRSVLFWSLELRTSELVWLKYAIPFLIRTERWFFFFCRARLCFLSYFNYKRSFPSCFVPHHESEAKCKAFQMKLVLFFL